MGPKLRYDKVTEEKHMVLLIEDDSCLHTSTFTLFIQSDKVLHFFNTPKIVTGLTKLLFFLKKRKKLLFLVVLQYEWQLDISFDTCIFVVFNHE